MKALDLFCGAGGASIGLHAAGYAVHGYDKWADALETHNHNGLWAGELDLSMQTEASWRAHIALTGEYDLMWGSPPCQGWSQGGKQLGEHDERNGFPWLLEAVRGVMPRLLITENVRGLTFKKNLPYLESEVIAPLRALGYQVEWRLLNCADYGVPQRRMRLFIIARLDGAPCWPAQTHSDPKKPIAGTLPWVTMAEALGWGRTDSPSGTVVGGSSRSGGAAPLDGGAHARRKITEARADGRWLENPDSVRPSGSVEVSIEDAATLQAFPCGGEYLVGFPRRADGLGDIVEIDGVEYRARDLTSSDEPAQTLTEKARSWRVYPVLNTGRDWKKGEGREAAQTIDPLEEPAPTVSGQRSQSIWQFEDGRTESVSRPEIAALQGFPVEPELPEWAHDEPAPTLSTTFGSVGGKKVGGVGGHRNLTLPEATILQAFPAGYEFIGTKTSQYLQIGNAVPPPMAFLLAVANKA